MGRPAAKKAKKKAAKKAERETDPEVVERRKRVPWTEEQVEALKSGVDKYGGEENRWARILEDKEFRGKLGGRSNVDLKDKWRNLGLPSPTKSQPSKYLKPSSEASKAKSAASKQKGGKAKAAPESEASSSSSRSSRSSSRSSSSNGINTWALGKRRRPDVEEDEDEDNEDEDEDDEEEDEDEKKADAPAPTAKPNFAASFMKAVRSIF